MKEKKNTMDGKKSLIFLGDIHGDFLFLEDACSMVEDSLIVQVGDCGLGFHSIAHEHEKLKSIDKCCKQKNNNLAILFGNHDSRKRFSFFRENHKFDNITILNDYEIIEYNGKTIQFVGGAISIDRTGRKEGVSYWSDEGVQYKPELLKEVDILVTHTAPSHCFPQTFNEMVYGWASEDTYLIEELTHERKTMDEIFKICKPKYHFYGHFHSSWSEEINGCKHRLLDINELYELKL